MRPILILLAVLVPLHLPFAIPSSDEVVQFGWWSASGEDGDGVVVRQTIWSARTAGLRPGDRILSVDGVPATPERVARIRDTTKSGEVLTLRVARGPQEFQVSAPVRDRSLSYSGYLWYRVALALTSFLIGIALVFWRGRDGATLALAAALLLLPPVLFPIELPLSGSVWVAGNSVWQVAAGAYRFFFPILILHFLTLPLRPLRVLRRRWIGIAAYGLLLALLLLVTDGLTHPLAWASPGVPRDIRSWAGLATEAFALLAALYAMRRGTGVRGPAQWLAPAAVFTFGAGVTVSLLMLLLPQAGLLAEGLRQVKSIMLLILMVTSTLYSAGLWEEDGGDWQYRGRLAAVTSTVFTALYAFAIAGAATVIHSMESRPEVMDGVLFVGIFVATIAYSPVLRWAREAVDRQMFAKLAERERLVHEFIDRISAELTPLRLAERISTELPPLLEVPAARLVFASEVVDAWALSDADGPDVLPMKELRAGDRVASPRAPVLVPIRRPDGEPMAALELQVRPDGRALDPADQAVCRTLAQGLASALRNTEAHLQLRAAERELHDAERVSSLGALAAGLAHEIKNPLAGLKMGLYLLERGGTGAGAEEKFSRIQRDVRRIDDLVMGVLRLTHEGIMDAEEPIDMNGLTRECLQEADPFAEGRGVRLTHELRAERPIVLGGREQVRLIVSNLLRNALDAVGEGDAVHLTLGEDAGHVELSVRDSGSGIEKGHLERIFDLSFSTKSGGTGIGLALVRREAERLAGSVEVSSAPGDGTELRVRLPRAILVSNPMASA